VKDWGLEEREVKVQLLATERLSYYSETWREV
jgi:hypothetical protein